MDNKHPNHSNQSGLAAFKASLFFKIIDWCLIYTMVFLCITVDTLAYSSAVQAAELPPGVELTQLIQVGSSTQTNVKRFTRTDFDFSYTLSISYIGNTPLQQVKGHLISLSPSTQIIDADIDFGNLAPGQTLTGKDTYTIRQDRSKPFNPSDLKWSFTYNHPPVADAGTDQSVPVDTEVMLDGTGSTDAEGDALTWRWIFTALPDGSTAALDNAAAPKPRFTVDRAGHYVVSLIVNDGNQDSAADTVVIDTQNSKPVADAGPDQTVATGDIAYLNGSASHDPDGDVLHYTWTLQETPAGSQATLNFADSANPHFSADKAGRYVVHLIVNDGKLDSEADLVIVSTRNSAPVADAGPDQSLTLGAPAITLDGSNSRDVDGQTLSYRWALLSAPSGSTAVIEPDNVAKPGFAPDLTGLYIVQLIVNDGELDSAPVTAQITVASPPLPPNQPPRITSSALTTGIVGKLYSYGLDATDPDVGDLLNYSLSLAPPGMGIDSVSGLIQWTPPQAGDFPVTAKVQDKGGLSDTQNYTLTVSAAPPANRAPQITSTPVITATIAQPYSYDVDATDPDGDALTYALTQSPGGMTIDASTGLIQWTPVINAQPPAVTVRVTDPGGLTAEQNFTISVVSANRAPVAVDDAYTVDQDNNLVIASNTGAAGIAGNTAAQAGTGQPLQAASVAKAYGNLPLRFEANQGQTDPQVQFLARGPGYGLFLTSTEAVMTLQSTTVNDSKRDGVCNPVPTVTCSENRHTVQNVSDGVQTPSGPGTAHQSATQPPTTLRLKLQNANPEAQLAGLDEQPGKSHYLIGNDPSQWRKNVPNYAKVANDDVYPGIDLVYYGNQRQLEYDFIVAPNADPKAIQMAIEGAEKVSIDADGNLILATPNGEIRQHKPIVYQETNGQRHPVEGRYVLLASGDSDAVPEGVETRNAPDGVFTPSATFGESGNGSTHETTGTGYISLPTQIHDTKHFERGLNPVRPVIGNNQSGHEKAATQIASVGFEVADYDHSQPLVIDPVLVYSTYLGGNARELGTGIAVDADGNAYIVGWTSSNNFPVTPGSLQPTRPGGNDDSFITKLSADGSTLLYSTYLGGTTNSVDHAEDVVVDSQGNAYVVGATTSSDFPVTPGAVNAGGQAFVVKLDPSGANLIYSAKLGAAGCAGLAIAADPAGNVYAAGCTYGIIPATADAAQPSSRGGREAFVVKLNPTGAAVIYGSYIGGSGDENGISLEIDKEGKAYVTGNTTSSNFPLANPLQATYKGGSPYGDAFVTVLNPEGTQFVFSSYLGGSGDDAGFGITVDKDGHAIVSGYTASNDFPLQAAFQPTFGGSGGDAFLAKIDITQPNLIFSTYLGGSGYDAGDGVAVVGLNNIVLTGTTNSTNFPLKNPIQANLGGDIFLAKFDSTGSQLRFSTYLGGSGDDEVKVDGRGVVFDHCGDSYITGQTSSSDFPTQSAFQPVYGGALDAFVTKILFEDTTDLSLSKTAAPDPILTGNQLTYHLTVNNLCAKDATGVKVSDLLPAQFAFTAATATQGNCNAQNGRLNCDLGKIGPKGSAGITVVGTVNAPTSLSLKNQAGVSADQDDPDPRNNTASATVLLRTSQGVLGNDSDPDGDALTAKRVTTTANGTLSLNPDGTFTYAPQAGFSGVDTFTYQANDGKLDSNIATVTITVNKVNHAPQITSTPVITGTATQAYGYQVTATDPDAGDTLTYSLGAHPAGMNIDPATGLIQWTPATDQIGPYGVTVSVADSGGLFQIQTYTVTVVAAPPVNHAPVAVDDNFVITQNLGAGRTIVDLKFDSLPSQQGWTYGDPNTTSHVPENRIFTLCAPDGFAALCLDTTWSPFGPDDGGYQLYGIDTSKPFTLIMNARMFTELHASLPGNAFGMGLFADSVNTTWAAGIGLTPSPRTQVYPYPPLPVPNGFDTGKWHEYRIETHASGSYDLFLDGVLTQTGQGSSHPDNGQQDIWFGTGSSYNKVKVAISRFTFLSEPSSVGNVLANDSDPDGDAIKAHMITPPMHGNVVLKADGSFDYLPQADFSGVDTFTYMANDGQLDSNIATVTITVTKPNQPPVITSTPNTAQWTELHPTGTPPAPMTVGSVATNNAYDEVNDRLILFGGSSAVTQHENYVWVLANATGTKGEPSWIKLAPKGALPTGRIYQSFVYDFTSNRLIVHGGCAGACAPMLDDTWVLTNANGLGGEPEWIKLPVSHLIASQSAGYDPVSNRMVIFGGFDATSGSGYLNEVRVLVDANGIGDPQWIGISPLGTAPPPRGELTSGVYDPISNRLIIFGGLTSRAPTVTNDVWVLKNANGLGGAAEWVQLSPIGIPPTPRRQHSMVYDPNTNRVMVFGGMLVTDELLNDAWVLTHANGEGGTPEWIRMPTLGDQTLARRQAVAAYGKSSNRMIVTTGHGPGGAGGWLFNDAWVLTNASGLCTANQPCDYDVEASDPDAGDVLSYALVQGPAEMTIDAGTGQLHWTPTAAQTGTHDVTVKVTDTGGLTATQSFQLTVSPVAVPNVQGLAPEWAEAMLQAAGLSTGAKSSLGGAITLNFDTLPSEQGWLFEQVGGVTENQVFSVSGGVLTQDTTSFGGVQAMFDLEAVDVRLPFNLAARTRVLEGGQLGVGHYVVTKAEQFKFWLEPNRVLTDDAVINQDNTVFHDYLLKGQTGGRYSLSIDGMILANGKPIPTTNLGLLQIGDPTPSGGNANAEYALLNFTQPQIATQIPAPGTLVNLSSAVDLGIQEGPATQTVPAVSGLAQTDAQTDIVAAGLLVGNVTTEASNNVPAGEVIRQKPVAGTHIMKNFKVDLVVSSTPGNRPPTITSMPVTTAKTGELYSYDVNATDPDAGDVLSYTLTTAITGMSIDSATGLIQWTPVPAQAGNQSVIVKVQDQGGLSATQSFTINVTLVNHAPAITSAPVQTASPNVLYVYDVNATDPDVGDTLTYSLTTAPGGMTINASSGLIQWTPTSAQLGTQAVEVRATDSTGAYAYQNFSINVAVTNHPPAITSTPPFTGQVDKPYVYAVVASDPDAGDTLTYSLTAAPNGMSIAPATGVVNWTPAADQTGDQAVMVKARDPVGAYATQSYTVTVAPANRAPSIDSSAPTVATENEPYIYALQASDPDSGDTLSYSLPTAPAGMTININTGLISWTPASAQIGDQPVVVRVQDQDGLKATQSYTVTVDVASVIVPNVEGDLLAVAQAALTAVQLKPGNVLNLYDENVPAGLVLSQLPQAGASVAKNTAVDLIVSQGPAPVNVPLVIGFTQAAAESALLTARLAVGTVTAVNSDSVPAGVIISQNPPANTSLAKNSPVDLVVSSGPALVTTPDVVGLTQAAAGTALVAANLAVGAVSTAGSNTVPAGLVISQSPFMGVAVVKGSAVDLVVSSGPSTSPYASLRVSPDNSVILSGETLAYSAIGLFADGSSQSLTNSPAWTSSQPGVATIDSNGKVTALAEGVTTISAQQDGVSGSVTLTVKAAAPGDVTPPDAAITAPVSDATITAPTEITGTASDANFLKYELSLSPVGQNQFTVFKTGDTAVSNGTLGTLDPTLLLNDQYTLRLTVWDRHNNRAQTEIRVQVAREQKVGNFTLAFQDVSVPMACMPITVTRVYDSRDKRQGDFGVGWRLDVKTMQLRESREMGSGWHVDYIVKSGPFGFPIPTYVLSTDDVHKVSLTLPDGHVEEFDLQVSPTEVVAINTFEVTSLSYAPRPGTLGSLAAVTDTTTWDLSSNLGTVEFVDLDDNTFNPRQYRYTAPDGSVYLIDKADGLKSVQCVNGQSLSFDANGISHSDGAGVAFTRDSQNRITAITDPMGNSHQYTYDGNGDLVQHSDPANQKTGFKYDYRHGLIEIDDPRGIKAVRNEYDADGRLIGNTDAAGKKISYNHDLVAKKETVTDRLGNSTAYEYDDKGNVLKQTDALGNETTYTYDAVGNQLTRTDALGRTTTQDYDSRRNVLQETDPLGHVTHYTYHALNGVKSITDPLGRVTSNDYDASGNLLSTADPLGNATTYGYDKGGVLYPGSGLMTARTDALGNKTSYNYDANGRMITETDPQGHVTRYEYDANGNRTRETRSRTLPGGGTENLVTTFEYDNLNRLVKTTQPDGSISQTVYNAIGKQAQTVDALGRTTQYEYDALGHLIKTTYPDGAFESSGYDAEGRRNTSTDRAGRTTNYTYDALGRLTATTYADGTTSSTTYDVAGQVTASVDALGHTTTYTYDDAGRRTKVTDALGHETTFTYDAAGNQSKVTDANGHVTTFVYDNANRRMQVVYPDGANDLTGYDALGRNTGKTDQAGKITRFAYDALGRLIKVTDALNQVTTYGYDERGNQISQTDANGHTTTFGYDDMGRRISRTLPEGQTESMAYNAAGNLISKTDFNGKVTTYAYDVLNRLLTKTPDTSLGEPVVSYSYTESGQRETMQDAGGVTTYSYDARDRLIEKATPQGALSYTYNGAGQLAGIQSDHADGVDLSYSYDALNRLAKVTDQRLGNGDTTYSYDNASSLAGYIYPNGVETAYSYNTLNRLSDMHVAKAGVDVARYQYTLGATGNRLSVAELSGRSVNYVYDELYRLTRETISGVVDPAQNGDIAYTYDPVGNRLTRTSTVGGIANQSFIYNANDQLNTDAYDANGNTVGSDGKTYAYDGDNHLIGQNSGQVQIVYDGDGNRVSKTVGSVTTQYLVDTLNPTGYAQVLEEIENGSVVRRYTYGSDLISQSLKVGSDWKTYFYGYDGHGSVRFLTDASGNVTDRYDYEGFGNLVNQEGGTANSYLYSGEQRDASLGLDYLRARYLNVKSGRFISLDPFFSNNLFPASNHRFIYTVNNPINSYDPTGLFTLVEVSTSVAIENELVVQNFIRGSFSVGLKAVVSGIQINNCYINPGNHLKSCALTAIANGVDDSTTRALYNTGDELVKEGQKLLSKSFKDIPVDLLTSLIPHRVNLNRISTEYTYRLSSLQLLSMSGTVNAYSLPLHNLYQLKETYSLLHEEVETWEKYVGNSISDPDAARKCKTWTASAAALNFILFFF